jgi:hypothetical protein
MAIKVTKAPIAEGKTKDNKGHTYIHFGGKLKERFLTLAEYAGYTRKQSEFGVLIFVQALAEAEADFAKQDKEYASKLADLLKDSE